MLCHTWDRNWSGHTSYSINKTTSNKNAAQTLWLTSTLIHHSKHCRNFCSAPNMCMSRRKQTPADYQFKASHTTKAQTPANGSVHPAPASVHCEPVCCVKANGRASLSAITAGQSSAASWVSIGHGSTVHYHMGVATSSLLEKMFSINE